ncbi:YfiT family bacillithiol transferase [Flavicella marina]|uniref:YfiT family bacillithiol transferase n=1 Tax=Flavicella marina TaxID=1475951 RepID=UPI0012652359|nr:putative metal-dependent hydrolase [Flavicella marina]
MDSIYKLKFPIGEFEAPDTITSTDIENWIEDVESFPKRLEDIVSDLNATELNYKYRPEGWTIKQVVHHCADSHMNSLIRFKLALTEDSPTIRPYFEDRFAELPDSLEEDLSAVLLLLKGLHAKLTAVMRNLSEEDLKKEYIHPEHGQKFKLEEVVGTYAWHSNHHLAHVKQALRLKY